MAALFPSGQIVELILGFMLLETGVLAAFRWRTGRGVAPAGLLVTLLSGATLLLALREALVGAAWPAVAFWLAASLVAHLADLGCRWSQGRRESDVGAVRAPRPGK